ncbi:MAG: 4-alpha-glucanotransferase [Pseudomonadota bacterium]|nr:4-alpha-glucanotransferase [Pseudomonadota bacterium]
MPRRRLALWLETALEPSPDPCAPAPDPGDPASSLHALAQALGLSRHWRDVEGRDQTVSDTALARIVTALGYPCDTDQAIARSHARLAIAARSLPAMLVTEVGRPTPLPASLTHARLTAENGKEQDIALEAGVLPAIDTPGYHRVSLYGHELTLAVAPARSPTLADLLPEARQGERLWGPAVQIPALRSARSGPPYGTLADLAEAVDLFAARGADALAINPVHALFAGLGEGYSPYSPSSRLHLNTALAAPELAGLPPLDLPGDGEAAFINWEEALPAQHGALRALFDALDPATRARIAAKTAGDESLQRQALFDALDTHHRAKGRTRWQDWPAKHRDPHGKGAAHFAETHAEDVAFHAFTQWLTARGLDAVQARAKAAGMAIGLVGDLAVGVHTAGADAWALQGAMLEGLTIGAPPDPLGPLGQNWTLTGFSPQGLQRTGYAPWIAMLRAALSRTGALRIDHAFGMARLWVIPEGEGPGEGAYLAYPFEDMLRLAVLEAHRAGALLIAENLGTAPFGFLGALEERRLLDMRVLWFERAADEGFIGAGDYPADSVAMTGTHDTATIAGWWRGRDLDWAQDLGRLPEATTRADAEAKRAWDRGLLWACLTHDAAPRPEPCDPAPVLKAALAHIGRSPAGLAIAPLEDILGESEQPNLPGTVTEHPNWRRRLTRPLGEWLEEAQVTERIAALDTARKGPADPPSG